MGFNIEALRAEAKKFLTENYFSGHDFTHTERVVNLCKLIGKTENADMLVLETAALLHDLGRDAERKDPSIDHAAESAKIAGRILPQLNYPQEKLDQTLYAIKVHRFSKGVIPTTLEAKILQDADRIDVCGAMGIAMTFSYGGAHGRLMYDPTDPFAENREPDGHFYSLDHFYKKLLKLPEMMHTEAGRKIAKERTSFMRLFLEQLRKEISCSDNL